MAFKNLPANPVHENFFGINTEDFEDINQDETPDSRNDDISEIGKLKTRAGMAKVMTIALAGGEVLDINFIETQDGVVTRLAIMHSGTLLRF